LKGIERKHAHGQERIGKEQIGKDRIATTRGAGIAVAAFATPACSTNGKRRTDRSLFLADAERLEDFDHA
jgi:hypothetical protein